VSHSEKRGKKKTNRGNNSAAEPTYDPFVERAEKEGRRKSRLFTKFNSIQGSIFQGGQLGRMENIRNARGGKEGFRWYAVI